MQKSNKQSIVKYLKLTAMISILLITLFSCLDNSITHTSANVFKKREIKNPVNTGMGNVETFMSYYNSSQPMLKSLSSRTIAIRLGEARGLSDETTSGGGIVRINKLNGLVEIEIDGFLDGNWDLYIVDNIAGAGRTTMADFGDKLINVGTFTVNKGKAKEIFYLEAQKLIENEVDRVFVSRTGNNPINSFVLSGAQSLIDKIENGYPELSATVSEEQQTSAMEELIARGREIFNNETFNGNGRTCATCHPEGHNFTVDPKFIATLPPTDPMFVAETNPDLAKNFEKPEMLRKFGLFVENVDGLDDLENKFTLRSSSSILAVAMTLKAPVITQTIDKTLFNITNPPLQRLGWGGDGAPGSGTLREFAIGAVVQHFPKTLGRKEGVDFRLPTDEELDALEAFQLSLGRSENLDLMKLRLKTPLAATGQDLFIEAEPDNGKTKKCQECHFDGGATVGFDFAKPAPFCLTCNPSDVNGTFDIGISDLKEAKKLGLPIDGGYATMPLPNGGFGACVVGSCIKQFNTVPLIEAADTAPFFHNHLVETIEDAVAHYGTKTFNKSDTGIMRDPTGKLNQKIKLNKKETNQIASFLRVINALENIRSSIVLGTKAKNSTQTKDAQELIQFAINETSDAIDVLSNGSLKAEASSLSPAINNLNMIKTTLNTALSTSDTNMRNVLIDQVISQQRSTRALLADESTLPRSFLN